MNMRTTRITGTLTEGEDRNLTLRIFINRKNIEEFVLQTGKQPNSLFRVIIMEGGKYNREGYLKEELIR